jgi:hypothetical protein
VNEPLIMVRTTGRELCDLFRIEYESIVRHRQKDQEANLEYIAQELLAIDGIRKVVLGWIESSGATPLSRVTAGGRRRCAGPGRDCGRAGAARHNGGGSPRVWRRCGPSTNRTARRSGRCPTRKRPCVEGEIRGWRMQRAQRAVDENQDGTSSSNLLCSGGESVSKGGSRCPYR